MDSCASAVHNSLVGTRLNENPESVRTRVLASVQAVCGPTPAAIRAYRRGVVAWLSDVVRQCEMQDIYAVYVHFSKLMATNYKQHFVKTVGDCGKWTVYDIDTFWPDNSGALKKSLQNRILFGPGADAHDSQNEAATTEMTRWSGPEYQTVQDWLRTGKGDRGKESADVMSRYFEEARWRVPFSPLPGVRVLYRGIHGDMAEAFQRKGLHFEKGFLAFSYVKAVARHFSRGETLMRLFVGDVHPEGTPWVWFGQPGQPTSLADDECEVLLPPGRLAVGTSDPTLSEHDVLPVTYQAFPHSMWPTTDLVHERWNDRIMNHINLTNVQHYSLGKRR